MNIRESQTKKELQRLSEKQSRLEARLGRAQQQVIELKEKCEQNARRMQALQCARSPGLGAHNIKNHQLHLVWRIVEAGLSHPDARQGLLQRELLAAVLSEFRELKPDTFRSYVHRFRKEGLIEKRGAYWSLKSKEELRTRVTKE